MNDLLLLNNEPIDDSATVGESRLVYNDFDRNRRVLTSLLTELKHCRSFCFSVAFITHGGLSCMKQQLLNSAGTVKGRIITTDYLNFNDPKALRDLLRFPNIEVRMYTRQAFHTKGYMFDKPDETTLLIGSSNLTQDALNKNKEWNIRVSSKDGNTALIEQTRSEFEQMWEDSEPLTEEWIEDYEPSYIKAKIARDRETFPDPRYSGIIKPNSMQEEALQNLCRLRNAGQDKALLISATGTGKTYLSAFDVKESGARKVLFLVHREQILDDARRSYQDILGPGIRTGKITGTQKDYDADFIFSTNISMSKEEVRSHFAPDHFDYIICDEAHHTAASTYNKILEYFRPKFLLGMTATPERMDGADVFERFNHNIAYEIRLQDALQKEMLCPFHYFGVTDIDIDGRPLDEDEDFNSLTSDERVRHIIEKAELYGYSGDRVKGLIFCRSKQEGRAISQKMNLRGLRTQFICDEDNAYAREVAVNRLEKDGGDDCLDYIITVDIFNEGVDIKSVNQIIMLRPTKSATIFIQQLGRGLRKMTRDNRTKEYLVVIDFIGNYQNNFMIPIALTGDSTMRKESLKKHLMVANEGIPGCSTVDFDVISKQRIYDCINRTTNGLTSMMKNTYRTLVNVLGYCPDLRYLYSSKKIDPEVLMDHYSSLNDFKRKLHLDCNQYSKEEDKALSFVSKNLVDGMRPHELLILRSLINEGSISLRELDSLLSEYSVAPDDRTLQSALSVLSGRFSGEYEDGGLLRIETDRIYPSELLRGLLTNNALKEDLEDVVECGLMKFEQEYMDGFDGCFKLFRRYSRADVCRLLNWKSKQESSTMYGYRVKNNTCPMFVTYSKDESISKSIQYADHFIDRSTFSWMTRNNVSIDGKEVTQILSPECHSYLFVKKDDDDSQDFFFMGHATPIRDKVVQTTITDDKGHERPIVNIPFKLGQPVPQEIYDYILGI